MWKGPNPFIENDSWALYAILNSACLITVPLLNWSGTLRRLGQKAASLKDPKALKTNGDVGTRTIVIYWAFLVLIGFICVWQQARYGEGDDGMEYPDLSKVICKAGTNASLFMSGDGQFHQRAIDSAFIQDNGCTDPCNLVNIPSIFRNQNDLVLLSHQQALLWDSTLPNRKYLKEEKLLSVEDRLFSLNYWTLPFIVVQGFITVFFGRRDPREIRDLIYMTLFMECRTSNKRWLRGTHEGVVRVFAGFNYLIACAVIIVCAPLFIISIIAQELQIWTLQPDSEKLYQVGQWSSWVYTVLVILAALIAKLHDPVIGFIAKSYRKCGSPMTWCFSSRREHRHEEPEHGMPSMAEKRYSNSTDERTKTDTPPSVEEMPSTKHPSTLTPEKEDKPKHGIWDKIIHIYKESCHPMNQTGNGPVDEMRNFYRWCRNPQEVSRMVVRHPIRQRDTKFIDAPPAVVDAEKHDPRAQDQSASFFRGASVEYQRGHA